MKFKKERKKLFLLFVVTAILFFLAINLGHYLTYKPLINRINTFAEAEYSKQRVEVFSYINHNAQLEDILAMKLEGVPEAIPLLTNPENKIDQIKSQILDQYNCYITKSANSFNFTMEGENNKHDCEILNLSKKAWIGGMSYALIGSILLFVLGLIVSKKLPDYIVQEYFG